MESNFSLEYFDKDLQGYYPVNLESLQGKLNYIVCPISQKNYHRKNFIIVDDISLLRLIKVNNSVKENLLVKGSEIDFKVKIKGNIVWRQGIVEDFKGNFITISVNTNYEINGSDSEFASDNEFYQETLILRKNDIRFITEYAFSSFELLVDNKIILDINRVSKMINQISNNKFLLSIISSDYVRVFDSSILHNNYLYNDIYNLKKLVDLIVNNEEKLSL